MECKYCKNKFSTKSSLNNHINRAKYCLALRGRKNEEFKCVGCTKIYTSSENLNLHNKKCSGILKNVKKELKVKTEENIELKTKLELMKDEIKYLKDQIEKYRTETKDVAMKAVSQSFEGETFIDIEESDDEGDEDENTDEEKEEYKLKPLGVGRGFTIEHREEDGYINVTNLCKAGGKKFAGWKRLDKTKAFLHVLSKSVQICIDSLIKYNTAYGKNRKTWVHPQVAINIAQWISPRFDVKVSSWVYEIMMTGRVDISQTKSYRELQSENKEAKLRIRYLEKKYLRKLPRVEYKEKYVIYILTTKLMKKERRYILGKATDLTSRLSTYNKSDEHIVVFYMGCGSEEKMDLVETMVFNQLKEYREQANRERFILPEEKEIDFFRNTIRKCTEFLK